MNVSAADPQMIKQLLLSQWINAANPLDPSPGDTAENDGIFGMILNDLLGSTGEGGYSFNDMADSPYIGWNGMTQLSGLQSYPLSLGLSGASLYAAGVTASSFDGLIASAAARCGLDPSLIKGVIQTESGFDANAVSHAGAKGLMQLMDDTARGLGVTDAFDPAQNIDAGSRFLSYLLRKYDGNVSTALAAYNAGPGRVDRLGLTDDQQLRERLSELPAETQRYIGKVLAAAQQWR